MTNISSLNAKSGFGTVAVDNKAKKYIYTHKFFLVCQIFYNGKLRFYTKSHKSTYRHNYFFLHKFNLNLFDATLNISTSELNAR